MHMTLLKSVVNFIFGKHLAKASALQCIIKLYTVANVVFSQVL